MFLFSLEQVKISSILYLKLKTFDISITKLVLIASIGLISFLIKKMNLSFVWIKIIILFLVLFFKDIPKIIKNIKLKYE